MTAENITRYIVDTSNEIMQEEPYVIFDSFKYGLADSDAAPLLVAWTVFTHSLGMCRPVSISANFTNGDILLSPPGYQKRFFPSEMAERIIRTYGIPTHNAYYYWRDGDRDNHFCPLSCGRQFIGNSIKAHLEKFHPKINSRGRKEICCRTQSHPKSKCPPKNVVQERYFVKHFTVMHSLAHSLCPFCLGRQTRVDHLHRHFAVCRVLRPKEKS